MSQSTTGSPRGKVYGYIRVSHERQAESGLSLQQQEDVIRSRSAALAEQHGLDTAEVMSDPAVSATRYDLRERPSGRRLDAIVRTGDHIVIAKLDRAFRSQRDCVMTMESWHRRGVTIHLLDMGVDTSTPSGKLVMGIMAAFAEWESARIAERIRDAKRAMRKQGKSTNGMRLLGYTVEAGQLVPHDAERVIAERVRELRDNGLLWREVAERLNADQVQRPIAHPSQKLTIWNAQSVARLYERLGRRWPREA